MRNLLQSFAVIAVALSFAACQKEGIVKPDEQTKVTHTVTFVADAPETKTVANIDRENGVVNYEWSSTDEDKDKFHVYENGVEGSVTAVSLIDGKMTISATFTGEEPAEVEYTGYFNEGVKASQQSYNTDYDQDSDVLIARADAAVNNQIQFRFLRLGAICEVNLKGLAAGECLKTVKIESLDENVFLAGSIVNGELVGNSKTITIDSYNDITDGVATIRFVSLPIENANLRFIVETTNDGDNVAAKYVKRLGKTITFTQGDLKAFNVSSFSTVETTATFKANGTTVLDAVLYAEGEDIVFPEGQDANAGNIFVGWTKNESYKAATAPSDLCTEDKMGAQSVVYNAVYGSVVGKAENPSRIVKLGASSSFAEGDVIAVLAKSGDNYYGMYQETVSTSYVQYYALDHEPELADFCGSNSDAKKSWNLTAGENSTWYLGDATNKYLRNATNNLYADAEDLKTATAVSIAWNNTNQAFTIKNDDRWIACRADLTGDNQYKYRGAGNSGSPTTNSLAYFDIYKLVDIESYSTTVDTRMNSSLAWSESSCSARMGAANTYPTLTTIPVGLEGVTYASSEEGVATISNDGTITLKAEGETTITASFAGNVGYKPADDALYVLTVLPAPSLHVARFSVNGAIDEEKNVEAESGSSITFPADPDGPYTGIVFKGWAKAAIVGTQDDAPAMVNKDTEKMGDEDVTYFAVFATETSSQTTISYGWEATLDSSVWEKNNLSDGASYNSYKKSGSYAGSNGSTTTAYIKTKNKISSPSSATCYYTKATSNNNSSSKFIIQTSTDGTSWTDRSTGKTMNNVTQGTFEELTADLSSISNDVYVRFYYTGTSAARVIDDVSITFGDIITTDYCTTVTEPVVLSRIEVSGTPDKTTYNDGENFDPAGLTVTAVYSDGNEVPVTDGIEWSATPTTLKYDSEVDSYSVNVTATALGKTSAVYTVNSLTVIGLTGIEVSGVPTKTSYRDGESFETAGLVVKAVYSNGNKETVTEGIVWSVSPETLTYVEGTETYSVEVTATALEKTSAVYEVNGLTVLTLTSISVKTAPTKVTYTEGDNFDPAGLVIYRHYSDETKDEYAYADHTSEFSFNPVLTAALATTDTKVTITYQGKPVDQAITVNEKQVPTFSSLEALVAADVASGTEVKVTFENVPIKSIYVTNGGYRNGIYFDIQKGGKDIEIYYQNVPNDWAVEGTVSGTMTCPWKNFNGTWELAPDANTWDWNNLSYTAPLEPCAPPEISITDAGSATISCGTAGATIYYTLGDSPADPTSASTRYTGAVTMTDGQTIKAIAYKDGMKPSAVASKKYTAGGGTEQVYKTALFGSSYNSKSVSSYTGSFSATNDGFTVDLANFNNNNNGWAYVKTGNKTSASVGTITTNAAVDKAVTKVVITIDAITASNVNSITLYSGTSADNCTTSEGTFTKSNGAQTVTISSPAANKFYKISFDCKKGSSNGLVTVSKVEYYAVY